MKKKVTRKGFFKYLAAGSAGAVALINIPFNSIKQMIVKPASSSIKVNENPMAVKREKPVSNNG